MTQEHDNNNILNYVGNDGEFNVPIEDYLDDSALESGKDSNRPKLAIRWLDVIRIMPIIFTLGLIFCVLALDLQRELLTGLIGLCVLSIFLAGYAHMRSVRIDEHLDVKRKSANPKPWRRLTGDEHKHLSQYDDVESVHTHVRSNTPTRTQRSTKLWRRLTGDEHCYISRSENKVIPRNLVYPPKRTNSTQSRRQLTGDEHRYISRSEDDYPKFNRTRRRRNK